MHKSCYWKLAIIGISVFFRASSAFAYIDELEPPLLRISEYKPIYFLVGTPDAKIQLSFKAQLVAAVPIYLAYTQLMFWELFQASPYFSDLSCNPEIFYRFKVGTTEGQWLDFGPIDHESNGQGGANERSWNRTYLRYQNVAHLGDRAELVWSIQVWVPYLYNPNNTDLAQYRGIWEGVVTLSNFLGPFFDRDDLTLELYGGGTSLIDPVEGGQQLTLRTKIKERAFLPLFVFQLFHGYAENLLNYKDEYVGARAGIGF